MSIRPYRIPVFLLLNRFSVFFDKGFGYGQGVAVCGGLGVCGGEPFSFKLRIGFIELIAPVDVSLTVLFFGGGGEFAVPIV